MKESFKFRIVSLFGITLAMVIIFATAACENGINNTSPSGGDTTVKTFSSITELTKYLRSTKENTPANPIEVKINMELQTDWTAIISVLNSGIDGGTRRYVALDLSGSTGTFMGDNDRSSDWVISVILPNTITSIKNDNFSRFSNLTTITIPNSVTYIGDNAFYLCRNLTTITMPNRVAYIGDYAFDGCSSITSVIIPSSVTYIGYYAFLGCSSLTNVIIQPGLTHIEYGAFYMCSSLTSITIPSSVISIEHLAFGGCTDLTRVTFESIITSDNFGSLLSFPGDLRAKYFATGGGVGTYTRPNGNSDTWTKQ